MWFEHHSVPGLSGSSLGAEAIPPRTLPVMNICGKGPGTTQPLYCLIIIHITPWTPFLFSSPLILPHPMATLQLAHSTCPGDLTHFSLWAATLAWRSGLWLCVCDCIFGNFCSSIQQVFKKDLIF